MNNNQRKIPNVTIPRQYSKCVQNYRKSLKAALMHPKKPIRPLNLLQWLYPVKPPRYSQKVTARALFMKCAEYKRTCLAPPLCQERLCARIHAYRMRRARGVILSACLGQRGSLCSSVVFPGGQRWSTVLTTVSSLVWTRRWTVGWAGGPWCHCMPCCVSGYVSLRSFRTVWDVDGTHLRSSESPGPCTQPLSGLLGRTWTVGETPSDAIILRTQLSRVESVLSNERSLQKAGKLRWQSGWTLSPTDAMWPMWYMQDFE